MRDFFKTVAASAVGTMVGLFTLLFLMAIGAFGLVGVLMSSNKSEPVATLTDKSVLVFDLDEEIIDGVPADVGALFEVYGAARSLSLYNTLSAIEAAATDDKVAGIYLTGDSMAGLATLKEIRQALSKFKESGKPIWSYSTGMDEASYYLASVADNLVLAPVGNLEINGFRAETQFLANALQKYGVGVQVLRVGRYKSAVEPFTRTQSSAEEKQQTQALISDLWQDFLKTVASDRKLTPAKMQSLADGVALIEPDQALKEGLVDRVAYYDEVVSELKKLTDTEADQPDEDLPQVMMSDYSNIVESQDGKLFDDKVAVIYAEGEIVMGEEIVPRQITSEGFIRTLREVRKDEAIKAVVLRVNSPGGSAVASEMITDEVQRLAKAKPLVVSMGDYAASGGYMISAPGAKILASPTTITGSIGVYGLLLNFQEIANKNGVTWDVVKTAKFADLDTVSRPQTADELKIQQSYVDNLYSRFTKIVADGRKVSQPQINEVAQGRVWTGEDAIAAKLVDQLGGLNDAIALAAKTANLSEYSVEELPRVPSLEEQLFTGLFGGGGVSTQLPWNKDPLTDALLKVREELTLLETLNDPNDTYMRLPFTTDIE
jgi:protease IV